MVSDWSHRVRRSLCNNIHNTYLVISVEYRHCTMHKTVTIPVSCTHIVRVPTYTHIFFFCLIAIKTFLDVKNINENTRQIKRNLHRPVVVSEK